MWQFIRFTNTNNKLYQTTNCITFLLSSLISLDTLYSIKLKLNIIFIIIYILIIESDNIYTLKNLSLNWIEVIGINLSLVKKTIATFIEESRNLLWEKEEI